MPAASLVPPMSIARAVSTGGSLTASPRARGGGRTAPRRRTGPCLLQKPCLVRFLEQSTSDGFYPGGRCILRLQPTREHDALSAVSPSAVPARHGRLGGH